MTPDTRTTENPEPCPECGTLCRVERHKLHVHYIPVEAAQGAAPRAEGLSVEALAEASMLTAGSQRIDGRIPALHVERAEAILHHLRVAPRAEGLLSEIEAHVNAQTVVMGRMWASGAHYVLRSIRRGSAEPATRAETSPPAGASAP